MKVIRMRIYEKFNILALISFQFQPEKWKETAFTVFNDLILASSTPHTHRTAQQSSVHLTWKRKKRKSKKWNQSMVMKSHQIKLVIWVVRTFFQNELTNRSGFENEISAIFIWFVVLSASFFSFHQKRNFQFSTNLLFWFVY